MKPDSIIFDLDGTLWDVTRKELDIWNLMLKEQFPDDNMHITMQDVRQSMGMTLEEISKLLFPGRDESFYIEFADTIEEYEYKYLHSMQDGGFLFDNTINALEILHKKYPLFIVSNCGDGYIEAFLETQNTAKYFTDFQPWSRTKLPKGDNILDLMKRNGLKNAVYIGDTEKDSAASRYAKIPFVFAGYGFGEVSDYDIKIDDIIELTKDNLFDVLYK